MSGALGGFDPKQTYDAASADYDDAARDYWAYLALRAVDRLGLVAGERVLDVPCGTGHALVAASERVGPAGRVVGLDYAEQMLAIAERRVAAAGLSVFGEQFVEPMRSVFVDAVHAVVPGFGVVQPWCRTEREDVLRALFDGLGIVDLTVSTEKDRLALPSSDDWWRIVMGSGLRRTVTEIGEEAAALVRRRCDDFIEDHGLTEVVSVGRYAVARRA